MKKRIQLAIIFGGRSAEHEVSLRSAKNIFNAINKEKYDVVLIGIDKKGGWHLINNDSKFILHADDSKQIKLKRMGSDVALVFKKGRGKLINLLTRQTVVPIDVAFPVLHGSFGEDGTIQGLLKLANIPFVGADVLGSATGMDKDVMKRLLRDAGIPIARFRVFDQPSLDKINFDELKNQLDLPFFVKPANLGSSIGITKVKDREQFADAIKKAFRYDNKILIEEYIEGREIECSILGNNDPIASVPGEILPRHDFYSYEAKYIDENGTILEVPANLPVHTIHKIQDLAIRSFKVLCCEGMARVDFFLRDNKKVVVSELNTIPGFTKISMYPKLWKASGISCTELIDRLIQLALERFKRQKRLETSFDL